MILQKLTSYNSVVKKKIQINNEDITRNHSSN